MEDLTLLDFTGNADLHLHDSNTHLPVGSTPSVQECFTEEHAAMVVDCDGNGARTGVLVTNLLEANYDCTRLKAICGIKESTPLQASDLVNAMKRGRLTVTHLLECGLHLEKEVQHEPYMCSIIELAKQKHFRSTSAFQVEKLLTGLRSQYGVKQKTIERDLRTAEQQLQSLDYHARVGVVSKDEVERTSRFDYYSKNFAIINTGGRAVIADLREEDLSKALMGPADFIRFHCRDWYYGPKGEPVNRANEFLKAPPPNTAVYTGGFGFKPDGIIGPNQFNLYRGFQVQPDPSGSCSLFYELIEDVWAHDDDSVYQWVTEWLMHTLAFPAEKVGTSLAIRGGQGDGKSIVFEVLMSHILGDMQLRVANRELILGNFNEALMGKLMTVLEEACFGNDLAAFDKMKELITGRTVTINPKFKAPITVDNYTRLAVVSNHDHFLNVPGDDRRYTVLESASSWNGTDKFEHLAEQWQSGGAERFLYDAMNHSFRRFDDRQKLIIQTNLKTEAAVRQRVQSRTPLQAFLVRCLLTGHWNTLGAGPIWQLDQEMTIASRDLETLVKQSASEDMGQISLHRLVPEFERLVGPLKETRPKAPAGDSSGKRRQLPKLRILPARSRALDHARIKGLITEEEHEAGLSAESVADATEFVEQLKEWTEGSSGVSVEHLK